MHKVTKLLFHTVVVMAAVTTVCAQERTAGSSIDVQTTWSTLTNMVNAANTKSEAVNSRVNQFVKCNVRSAAENKSLMYAPGVAGADGDGCVQNTEIGLLRTQLTTLDTKVQHMAVCDAKLKMYVPGAANADGDGCVPLARTCKQSDVQGNVRGTAYAQKYHLQFYVNNTGKIISQRVYAGGSQNSDYLWALNNPPPGSVGYRRADQAVTTNVNFLVGESFSYQKFPDQGYTWGDGEPAGFQMTCTDNGWVTVPMYGH